jgi:uncharacterized membrane protein
VFTRIGDASNNFLVTQKGFERCAPLAIVSFGGRSTTGKEYEAIFEITLQLQENRLLWRSISGANNSGVARFDPVKGGGTKITLIMEYEPGIGWQSPAAISKRLQGYLKGFKEFIEAPDAE